MENRGRWARTVLFIAFQVVVAMLVIEFVVRTYPPIELRVKGETIELPVNTERIILNDAQSDAYSSKLDSRIVVRKNSLGFRGEDPPEDFDDTLTLVTVGASTTECYYLTEGTTWPDRLGQQLETNFTRTWINNAGLDGHSTFGHTILLREFLVGLRPDIVLFLVGGTDPGAAAPNSAELGLGQSGIEWSSFTEFLKSTANYSDAVALALHFYRYKKAVDLGFVYRGQLDLADMVHVSTPAAERVRQKTAHREGRLARYRSRLEVIIELSRGHGIEPVFVTQPALFGPMIDDVTGVDLGTIDRGGVDGNLAWEILELYHDVTRAVGEENAVLVVDLARELPKSSLFYYDLVHYTKEGAAEIGSILSEAMCPFLAQRFPEHLTQDCSKRGAPHDSTPIGM
jgi:hypothetical protein